MFGILSKKQKESDGRELTSKYDRGYKELGHFC